MSAAILEWPHVKQWTGETPPWVDEDRPCVVLTARMVYRTAAGQLIIVPAGYVTDLASIPRGLWWILPPHGELMTAAILHDWLYSHGGALLGVPRSYADGLFKQCAGLYSVTRWKRKASYRAVRLGGRGGWVNGWHTWPEPITA